MRKNNLLNRNRQAGNCDLKKVYQDLEETSKQKRVKEIEVLKNRLIEIRGSASENDPKYKEKELLTGLKLAVKMSGRETLTAFQYDEFRNQNGDLQLASTSVIRKWLGSFEAACAKADIKTLRG